MIREIEGASIDRFPFDNLRLISDLIYFEGPLLSYFKDNRDQHYLYYWCDSDDMYNRWLVFKTTERTLREFLTQQLTLRDLILACNHEPMYLVDINDELQYAHIVQVPRSSDLPADYIPETDTYYDASLSVFHDEQATRELMIMMQRALQDVQAKLRMVEQVVAKSPEEIHAALSTS